MVKHIFIAMYLMFSLNLWMFLFLQDSVRSLPTFDRVNLVLAT